MVDGQGLLPLNTPEPSPHILPFFPQETFAKGRFLSQLWGIQHRMDIQQPWVTDPDAILKRGGWAGTVRGWTHG